MRRTLLTTIVAAAVLLPHGVQAAPTAEDLEKALSDIQRSMAIIDAAWSTSIKGTTSNLWMADTYDTTTGATGGACDVWPYTAAIEAHCSLLEALDAAKELAPQLYADNYDRYRQQLATLIDNLEYYRGTYSFSSYATFYKSWSPYAVHRANERAAADVAGILNVYDDQMWLARELIRAYRLTGTGDYLATATYLVDYALNGWDCWRDADGNEYGGITWGPGYNSKHSCSNGPVVQPLVWLSDLYKDSGSTTTYRHRNADGSIATEERLLTDHYLDFAARVYNWQKTHLLHSSGTYWDMMGADNTIKYSGGYRSHVDCGEPTGSLFSYNTGAMISGAAELYRATEATEYRDDLNAAAKASLAQFSKYVRRLLTYDFATDEAATSGFNTWFNDVLMRSYVDAAPYADNTSAATGLKAFQTNLDYAFDNHNRNNLLPIRLLDGWGDEVVTKAFHQFAFASEYAMLAVWLIGDAAGSSAIVEVRADAPVAADDSVYTISGVRLGEFGLVKASLPKGFYVVGSRKLILGS